MSEATIDPPAALTLLRRAEHVLFVVLLLVGAGRCVTEQDHAVAAVVGASALLGWYVLGLVLARRSAGHAVALVWLLILTVGWGALIALSANFVWLAFPLMLLYLQLTPLRFAMPAVLVLTAATIAGLGAHRGQLDTAAVIGPILGAGVATVITLVYQGLRRESETRARLVTELTAAQQRLAATERRAGTLVERDRLARELHDTVAQSLASIVLLLRSASRSYIDAPEPARRQLDTALEAARSALDDTRRMVRALAPAELVDRPLDKALQRILHTSSQLGLHTSFVVDGEPTPLPTPVTVALLRVAQGAVANVTAHAAATRVGVTLTFQPDAVSLDIVDDGSGFDPDDITPSATAGTGFGLRAMRSRLAEVGGTLVVESSPDNGTAISAIIPIEGVT
jgi:signal transduction histidine kinase